MLSEEVDRITPVSLLEHVVTIAYSKLPTANGAEVSLKGIGSYPPKVAFYRDPTASDCSHHLCAVKSYPRKRARSEKQIEAIFRERDILKSLSHHSIIQLYRTDKDEASLYFVMEAALGGPLYKHIRAAPEGRLPPDRVAFYTAEIALALQYLRSNSVVHRDLKGSNIVLDQHGHVKIVDFGVATVLVPTVSAADGQTIPGRTFTYCGSLHAMAPEVLRISDEGYSFEVDYWSLGVLIWEMALGEPPFGYYCDDEAGDGGAAAAAADDGGPKPRGTDGDHEDRKVFHRRITKGLQIKEWQKPTLEQYNWLYDLVEGLLQVDPVQRFRPDEVRTASFFHGRIAEEGWNALAEGKLLEAPGFDHQLGEIDLINIGGERSVIDYDVRRDLSEQLDDDAAQQDSDYPISYPVSSEPWSESRFLVNFVKTMDLGDATEDGSVIDSTNAFLGAFYPAAATTIIALTSFLLLRPYFPDVYDCKRERVRLGGSKKQREGADDMPPELPKTLWKWIMLLASFSDEDIIRFIGADSLVFLRFLRMCFKASICMMLYGFIVLLPLNILGANNLPQFERLSASNIGDKSNFLYAHLVGAYLFTALVLYLLYKEYNVYVDLRQRYMKSPSVQSYSIVIRDIPTDVDRETVERYLTGLLGHESVAIHMVENAAPYDKLIDEKDSALFGLEGAKQKYEKTQVRPRHKTGLLGLWGEQVDSLDYYEEKLKEVNNNIQKLQEGGHGFAHAAIVTFETIRVATAFQHIPLQSAVRFMKVSTCPARNDLLWNNLGVPLLNRGIRTLLVIGMVFFIIFCYTIPVSFVSSLANLQALARTKHLEWLQPVADFSPELTALLQGLVPPAILGLFFSLIPTFMVMLSRAECPKSESEAQTRAIWKVFLFSLFDNFLVVTFAGAVLEKLDMLKEVAGHPAEIINLLATTLPSQSNFFMNFIMVAGLSVMPLEILRLTPFIITKLKRKFLCSSQWDHLKAMTEDIGFHECYAFPLLVFLPMMSFSVLSPIMMIFVFAYYGLTYCIWLNQLLYVYNVPYHTGGSQFTVVFRCCIVSLAIFQLLLAGVFGLKRVTIPAALMIPLLVITVFMGYTLTERFRELGNTLTLENLLTTDVKEMSEDTVEALKKAYTLYQDDGSNDGFSHRTLQPLVEPYSITTDGLLADLVDDQTMQADVTLNDELQKEIDGDVAAAGGRKGVDDEEHKFESVENGI